MISLYMIIPCSSAEVQTGAEDSAGAVHLMETMAFNATKNRTHDEVSIGHFIVQSIITACSYPDCCVVQMCVCAL
jgi:hypothetical protein